MRHSHSGCESEVESAGEHFLGSVVASRLEALSVVSGSEAYVVRKEHFVDNVLISVD